MIAMGNDEFILYIRKRHPECRLANDNLGQRIWSWILTHDPQATKVGTQREQDDGMLCMWGDRGTFIGPRQLPKTATQFRFQRALRPDLYTFLDAIAQA